MQLLVLDRHQPSYEQSKTIHSSSLVLQAMPNEQLRTSNDTDHVGVSIVLIDTLLVSHAVDTYILLSMRDNRGRFQDLLQLDNYS